MIIENFRLIQKHFCLPQSHVYDVNSAHTGVYYATIDSVVKSLKNIIRSNFFLLKRYVSCVSCFVKNVKKMYSITYNIQTKNNVVTTGVHAILYYVHRVLYTLTCNLNVYFFGARYFSSFFLFLGRNTKTQQNMNKYLFNFFPYS